jgi:hypothetical protein
MRWQLQPWTLWRSERKYLETDAGADLLREMVKAFAETLMSAEASAMCGAAYGERSPERVNARNGYRTRRFDTRVGSIELAIPKLRRGSYFPDWLLEPRRRAERALVQVVCQCYVEGVSTRAVEEVVKALGMQGISKSQVSEMAKALGPGGGRLPEPPPGRGALHLRLARRPRPARARGGPHRQRRRGGGTAASAPRASGRSAGFDCGHH